MPSLFRPRVVCVRPKTVCAYSLLLCLMLATPLVPAQDVQMVPDKQDQQSAAQAQADKSNDREPTETLKVNVNVVQLFFNVKDKKGGLIANLTKNDFDIAEDGKPQTIKYFAAESDLPLTLGILIDASGSQARVLDMEKQVGGNFLAEILREKDLAFVIGFDVNVDLLQDFTNSVSSLKKGMNTARINTGGGGGVIPGMGG